MVSALRVRKQYIEAIEAGDVSVFSSESYYYGYLKQYLHFLKIEDVNIDRNTAVDADLAIDIPVVVGFKPNLLLIIISIILSVVIYNFCVDIINKPYVDPIALELHNNIPTSAKIN